MKKFYIKCFLSLILLIVMIFNITKPVKKEQKQVAEVQIETVNASPNPAIQKRGIIPSEKEQKKLEFNNKLNEIKCNSNKEWFVAYKELIYQYAAWEDAPETVYDYFTEDEVRLICRVVETEAYDQDFDSKCNVASVVFNRIESGKFGDTVEEVVTSPNQFAYGRENLTEDTILAVMYAYEIGDTAQGALYFHSNEKTDKFCGRPYIFTDDAGHHFY